MSSISTLSSAKVLFPALILKYLLTPSSVAGLCPSNGLVSGGAKRDVRFLASLRVTASHARRTFLSFPDTNSHLSGDIPFCFRFSSSSTQRVRRANFALRATSFSFDLLLWLRLLQAAQGRKHQARLHAGAQLGIYLAAMTKSNSESRRAHIGAPVFQPVRSGNVPGGAYVLRLWPPAP